jgi:hypothetical protein
LPVVGASHLTQAPKMCLHLICNLISSTNALLTRRTLVLKQVHPDTGISNRAMSILNSFVNGMSISVDFHMRSN